jgi:hypothetical protein
MGLLRPWVKPPEVAMIVGKLVVMKANIDHQLIKEAKVVPDLIDKRG